MERIYLSPPDVGLREREFLLDAFDSNWIAPLGPHVDAFESEVAQATSRRYAVATCSGTAALHLALHYYGVGVGDQVVTSSLTFVATANAIRYLGAEPVFIDSVEESWNIDVNLLWDFLRASSERGRLPRAVVPVDLYGQCADYDEISRACATYGVPLVVDAAESLGARFNGRPAGSVGEAAILSFNGNKIITTSGGGMLVTDDERCAEKTRHWATQARDSAPHYEHSELGYNYRMSNLLAAIGRAQLENLESKVEKRRAINQTYRKTLGGLPGIRFMPEASGCRSTFWLTALTIDPSIARVTRDRVIEVLTERNIEARPVWKPMHLQPLYSAAQMIGGEVSERLFRTGVCLPSGSNLTEAQQQRVIDAVREAFA